MDDKYIGSICEILIQPRKTVTVRFTSDIENTSVDIDLLGLYYEDFSTLVIIPEYENCKYRFVSMAGLWVYARKVTVDNEKNGMLL